MNVLAIDPGPAESAWLRWNGQGWHGNGGVDPNDALLGCIREGIVNYQADLVAIEMIASFGMPVGREVFETCLLIGRLIEALDARGLRWRLVYRSEVKMHHCQSPRAKDANIRQALIDKYGAPGTKKAKGVTYGIKSHLWSALAIATYITENSKAERNLP